MKKIHYLILLIKLSVLYVAISLSASLGATVKLHFGDWLVMDSNPEADSLHMQR